MLDMVTSPERSLLSSSLCPYLTIPQLSKEPLVHCSTRMCWVLQSL